MKVSRRPLDSHPAKVSYVCRGPTLLGGSLHLQTVALKRARVLVLVRFIKCLVSTYCRQSWGLVKKQSQKTNVDSATWGTRRHFHRVFNLAALWEIKGPSDVLPVPLKMHRAPLLICFLLPFSLCTHRSLWSGESLVPNALMCVCACGLCSSAPTLFWSYRKIEDQQKGHFLSSWFPCSTMQVNKSSRLQLQLPGSTSHPPPWPH